MQPREKVPLLRRVASTLAGMNRTDMDLALGEFGFPNESCEGDAYEYALKQLREGTIDALVELHRYFQSGGRTRRGSQAGWRRSTR